MSNRNVKLYKNPDREKPETMKRYVPQYQLMGVEPEEYHSSNVPTGTPVLRNVPQLPPTNPRASRSPIRQPYAVQTPSPVGRGRGPVPNIGNSLEHTWSSVDGEIIDDVSESFDENHQFIDNNDFVTESAFSLDSQGGLDLSLSQGQAFLTEKELKNALNQDSVTNIEEALSGYKISDDELILMVKDTVFAIGDVSSIEKTVRELIFGEHPVCDGVAISVEDLLVLKSVPIKIGVFLG
jgi:hypothetical protein